MKSEADAAEPVSDSQRLLAFCGHCRYFEMGVFGDTGVCHKNHSPLERAKVGTCADRSDIPVATGPNFDMSE